MSATPHRGTLAGTNPARDRRTQPRHFICFGRPLYVSWLREDSLLATLIDVSRSGFRLSHQYRQFHPGQEVNVSFPKGVVRAKVVWNKVGKKNVQTGFVVIEGSALGPLCPK